MSGTALSVLLAALGAVAVACGGGSSSKPGADEVAGKVIEVAGAVSAQRGGQVRTLEVGAHVFGGDEIVTAANGSVTIEIDHNRARWTLGAGKTRRLDKSVVWNAPKASKAELLARAQTDKTIAAGRHAEKSSAGTAATASAPTASAPPPPAAAPVADPTPPGGASTSGRGEAKQARRTSSRKRARRKKIVKPKGATKSRASKKSYDFTGDPLAGGGGSGEGRRGGGPGQGNTGIGTTGRGGSPIKKGERRINSRVRLGKISVTAGKLDTNAASRVLRVRTRGLRSCYDRALRVTPTIKGQLIFTLKVAGTGAVAKASVSGARALLAATKSCLVAQLRRLRFPKASDGGVSTVVVIAGFSSGG